MPVLVTLHVFSGRPDPTWIISDEDGAALEAEAASFERPTLAKPPGTLGRLGYRGFSLSRVGAGGAPLDLYVHEGVVDRGRHDVNVVDEARNLEQRLLGTAVAQKILPPEVLQHVTTEIQRPAQLHPETVATPTPPATATAAPQAQRLLPWPFPWPWPWPPKPACPPCHAADAPPYQPGNWNIPQVQPHNNCYNYANNRITNTFAQPGLAHNAKYTILQCNGAGAVEPAAVADGVVPVPNFAAPLGPGKGWYVALVIWPNVDFHWYRQDNVGCWSHKPGSTAVRNVDNSGHLISDPKTADRGGYVNFCTYMITNHGVVIR
jgi:hypothetical protein